MRNLFVALIAYVLVGLARVVLFVPVIWLFSLVFKRPPLYEDIQVLLLTADSFLYILLAMLWRRFHLSFWSALLVPAIRSIHVLVGAALGYAVDLFVVGTIVLPSGVLLLTLLLLGHRKGIKSSI